MKIDFFREFVNLYTLWWMDKMDLNILLNPSMSKLDESGAREVSEIFENFFSQK